VQHHSAFSPSKPVVVTEPQGIRVDIQFLRGVSVLAVVLFHGFGDWAPRGYLGVDVFFVISGFLVTGIVMEGLDEGKFSFAAFYLRRAKRLLPAAYATFLATTIASYAFLTSVEWHAYVRQLFGAITYTANIVLARQTGYFEAAAEGKPLLHLWSLSLEEQFYLLMPVLLWVLPRRLMTPALFVAFFCSIGLCFWAVEQTDWQTFAFYMLPPRAWELIAGALVARFYKEKPASIPVLAKWTALSVILLIFCSEGLDRLHPRFDALICVLATALILAGSDGWLPQGRSTSSVVRVGDWSYSIYLVHWPIFCFAHLAYLGTPPTGILVVLTLAAILLGGVQYATVEQHFRVAWRERPNVAWTRLAFATAAVALIAMPRVRTPASESFQAVFAQNRGLSGCDLESSAWPPPSSCYTSPRPTVAVWGDSNAMHLVPGLVHSPIGGSLVQLTRSNCAPILGIAQVERSANLDWAKGCIAFNEHAVAEIVRSPTIKVVVIGSSFAQLLVSRGQKIVDAEDVQDWTDIGVTRLAETITRLQRAGKVPVIVAPIPWPLFDPAECNLRRMEHVVLIARGSCDFSIAKLDRAYWVVLNKLRLVSAKTASPLFIPERVICDQGICRTRIDEHLIYRNKDHLSVYGSALVLQRLGLPSYSQAMLKPVAPPCCGRR
jgi:peptidoglycan/LPS O-acetylase OafA/YrhL